ncbi:MAG: C69 family dipeptidase [Rikenellaceae bacterium]|nr:C69 family dipeptidase [Rikenellaceae bacterium]
MRTKNLVMTLLGAATMLFAQESSACTNVLVTKGASADGSTMITYTADSHTLYGALKFQPAAAYPEGTMMKIYEWDTGKFMGEIPQVRQTYSVVGNMNEHQLLIGETTFGGREELYDSTAIMDYGSLIYTTLQRARTAREAIKVIAELVEKYGYASSGESFSIADPNEVWYMEIISKGMKFNKKGENVNKGAVWVALRVPDGYISAHANQARIRNFPMNDPENCVYSKDVIDFAREMKYFKGKDSEFSFCDAYAPLDFSAMRACEARVWAIFRNAKSTEDMDKYLDYAMGHNPNNRMPLWVKPAEKLTVRATLELMRDHYDGTPMDMHTDIGAGGHGLPYRWRPMQFEVDGVKYVNERATATQQTGFWFLGQCRSWLPNPIGGVFWFGVDDTGNSTVTPIYCGATRVPECISEENGSMTEYSPTSLFWLVNRVTKFSYLRYDRISEDIHKVIDKFENDCLTQLEVMDKGLTELYAKDKAAAIECLTDFSERTAQKLFDTWTQLDQYLLVKYKDGNIMKEKDGKFLDNGNNRKIPASPEQPGYNEAWKRAVAADKHSEILKVK